MTQITLLILLLTPLITTGCATPYARQWQSQLWTLPQESDVETEELGAIETEDLSFELICTGFRQVGNPSNAIIGIGTSCRNETEHTYDLGLNPIQVINASNSIVKPLPLDHVMYKFYGGTLREALQIERLNTPPPSHGDSIAENVLGAVVAAYRAYEHGAIISEFHRKEALPYDLFYESFAPTSLPSGVSAQWIQYYPATTETITVMLQGQGIEDGVIFRRPPPPPPTPIPKSDETVPELFLLISIGLGLLFAYQLADVEL
ncbi:MAG: hypothetical protein OXN17_17485 [Candidatus Poribacteria bacterium]|nr:hypothetical protein [Candidatus Poribacteria bacterium]MDE0504788.1 hypothetical protein [Candidatus Poribacteria bacterium]